MRTELAPDDLWLACKAGDLDARNTIAERHLNIVWFLAHRTRRTRYLDVEDLAMCGVLGLLEAIDRYDPELGAPFTSFAYRRIHGAMLDAARRTRWLPPSRQRKASIVRRLSAEMEQSLGRHPSLFELAAEIGVPLERLDSWRRYEHLADFTTLDAPEGEREGKDLIDLIHDAGAVDPADSAESAAESELLEMLISQLDPRSQSVVRAYYFEGLSQKEVGQRMGVSQSRVCQIHTKALRRLRSLWEPVAA